MREINFADAQQALAFLVPQMLRIETEVYEVRYPNFAYEDFLFVNEDGDMWDAGLMYFSGDIAGKAEWFNARDFDVPYADVSRDSFMNATHMAAIGYEWSRGELERAARANRNLTAEKANAARRVAQRFIYGVALMGAAEKGWTGLFNNPNVPSSVAVATFAAGTPDQILATINGALAAPAIATRGAYNVNAMVLPTTAIRDLGSRIITNTTTTILNFIQANNNYTAQGGGALFTRGTDELETLGGSATRRMVTYERDRQVAQFHLPGDHEFFDVFQKSSFTWEVPGLMNLGGTEIRVPKAIKYTDGI